MADHHASPAGEPAATLDALPSLSSPLPSGGGHASEDNRIKVVCRVRPPVSRETHGAKGLANRCVAVGEDKRTVMLNSKPQGKNFTFDYAAGEDSTQEELFAEVRLRSFLSCSLVCSLSCWVGTYRYIYPVQRQQYDTCTYSYGGCQDFSSSSSSSSRRELLVAQACTAAAAERVMPWLW